MDLIMETREHKNAGDLIRIETFDNHYLKGSEGLSEEKSNTLEIQMMHKVDDIPVPLALKLTAGDIVALAGDYYTKAGWGLSLETPSPVGDLNRQTQELFKMPVKATERKAFRLAYHDLASPNVTQKNIESIYRVGNDEQMPDLEKEAFYAQNIENYSQKLNHNEAHFSPWSVRAHIVGHHSALAMAKLAYVCKKGAAKETLEDFKPEREKIKNILTKIQRQPGKYGFKKPYNEEKVLEELSHRYHALAIARDLFSLHFYSDHFAGGHLNRLGVLRKTLPEKFGVLGSILVNNMHNEDNTHSVTVTNPFQPPIIENKEGKKGDDNFQMIKEENQAYGDGTYFERGNDENANMLINGMDNSLGDIARLMVTGKTKEPENYGGLAFLPAIDFTKPQTQPMFLHGPDGQIYFRSNISQIKTLSPTEYKNLLAEPDKNGYEKLSYFKSLLLVIKLRVLGRWYAPKKEDRNANAEIIREESLPQTSGETETVGAKTNKSVIPESKSFQIARSPSKSSPGTNRYAFHTSTPTTPPIDEEQPREFLRISS